MDKTMAIIRNNIILCQIQRKWEKYARQGLRYEHVTIRLEEYVGKRLSWWKWSGWEGEKHIDTT